MLREQGVPISSSSGRCDPLLELVGNAVFGLCLADCTGRVLAVSREWMRLTGLRAEEAIGAVLGELFPDVVNDVAQARGGEPTSWRRRKRVSADRELWWEGQFTPTLLAEGPGLLFSVRAVDAEDGGTASIAQYDELERDQQALATMMAQGFAETLAVLEGLFSNAPLGIAYVDRELRFRRVNRAVSDFNGVAPEAHIGRRLSELFPAFAEATEIEAAWRRILASGVPALDVEVSAPNSPDPQHRRVWRESWYPVVSGLDAIGIGVIGREVTAEREAEQFRSHLVGIVSHDLRTPLSALRLGTETLLRGKTAKRYARILGRMQTSATRMERIINELLDFTLARSEHGIPLDPAELDLDALCRDVIEEVEAARPGCRVRYSRGIDGRGRWDMQRMIQMLTNLIENALSHGSVDPPPELRWRTTGSEATIEVANRGTPIPEDVLPYVFEPLRQGASRGRRGIGLGLFIARHLARAHGGEIDVASLPDETVFRVRLPREWSPQPPG